MENKEGGLDQAARDHITTGVRPTNQAVLQFAHFPVPVDRLVPQARKQSLQGWVDAGHHRVWGVVILQDLKDRLIREPRVGADANLADIVGDAAQDRGQHLQGAVPGGTLARAQLNAPEGGRIRFQAEQRMIGAASMVARVIADRGVLLVPADGHDGAVEVED